MARPAEFDRTDVLEKAMNVFWRTGYNASSITDLVKATSLNRGPFTVHFTASAAYLWKRSIHTVSEASNASKPFWANLDHPSRI